LEGFHVDLRLATANGGPYNMKRRRRRKGFAREKEKGGLRPPFKTGSRAAALAGARDDEA
jgi:hypothetical protein